MKDRLVMLLDMEHLTPSKFADLIGVQRSSVSHVLSGRNKPSFDFLEKTLGAFPGLEADWLIMGKGHMYEQMGRSPDTDLFTPESQAESDSFESEVVHNELPADVPENAYKEDNSTNEIVLESDRKVVQVMVFYDDNTFSTYRPSL